MQTAITQHTLMVTYLVLMALLALAFGAYFIDAGTLNIALNLGIAVVKTLLIMAVFMQLSRAGLVMRMVAAAGFFWLMLLLTLSLSDYLTRV